MKCGFGPDAGEKTGTTVCPAARKNKLDGVHGGSHGGRACWFVKNTKDCGNGAGDDFSNKYPICMNCRFYWKVRQEEGKSFELSLLLNTYFQAK